MTYALSSALQTAVYERISGDPQVVDAVGSAVFDAPPAGQVPDIYIVLGQEDTRDRSDVSGQMADHRFTVSVYGSVAGFLTLKSVAASIDQALTETALPLSRGHLVSLRFLRARARRENSANGRRVDMTFRALIDDI